MIDVDKSRGASEEQVAKAWARSEARRIRAALFTLKGFGFEQFGWTVRRW